MKAKILRNGLYSAVTAAALVFGASQAFATPQVATARVCDPWEAARCHTLCQDQGYDAGTCDYGSYCRCWFN